MPDYLTTPAIHHGTIPPYTDRSPLECTARALVARALSVLTDNGQPLAAYTATGHCITEGAHVAWQTLTSDNRANVILDLQLVHFDTQLNPRSHPGYPALRAARVAQADRRADLFRTEGWQA